MRLATRGDRLAVARAEAVAAELRAAHPGLEVAPLVVATHGAPPVEPGADPDADAGVAALRQAVRDGAADVAVHAVSDLPPGDADGLRLAAVPMRADPRDVLVARAGKALEFLPAGTRIGTSSPCRAAQLLRRRGDVVILPLRGDVQARLDRLDAGEVDALVLAAADLDRLGLLARVTQYFDTDLMIPTPGQGALALEARDDDEATLARLAPLHDEATAYAVRAERVCLARLGGLGRTPIGIFALTDGEIMAVHGIVARPDGSKSARLRWSGPWREADDVGETLAELLLAAGAGAYLTHAPEPRPSDAPPNGRAAADPRVR